MKKLAGLSIVLLACLTVPTTLSMDGERRAKRPRWAREILGRRLHYAIELQDDDKACATARGLLEQGADVDARGDWNETPLRAAADIGFTKMASLLLKFGANIYARDNRERPPLHCAVSSWRARSAEMVRLLLDHGADVNAKDWGGWTALHHAAHDDKTEIAALLLDRGANVDATDNRQETSLAYCLHWKRTGMIDLLLASGADINTQDDNGLTPLHLAVLYSRRRTVVRGLLEHGAQMSGRGEIGWGCW